MPLAPSIAEALERGATVVAANPRAARSLQLAFAAAERSAGREVWPAPPILDWDSWLRELYSGYAFAHPDAPMLLSSLQERALWRRVQREDAARVVSPDSMASLAMEAWSLLSDYTAHAARRSPWAVGGELTDAERFRAWAAEFERECARNRWISFSQIAPLLTSEPSLGTALALPLEVCLVGFDRITPAQRGWLAALASRNLRITEYRSEPAPGPQQSERQWIAAVDARAEISACAAWARDILLENPAARIGIIVPHIADLRGEIERIFRRVLMPASEDILQPSAFLPYEFSLGQPLADVPAVGAALLLLRWIDQPLPKEEISWLMLSGFVAETAAHPLAIARHDASQPRALQATAAALSPDCSLADYAGGLARNPALGSVHHHLAAVLGFLADNHLHERTRQPSAWSDLVPQLLERAGWPGRRAADSVQFQALQRWQRLLDDLALLDFDDTRCHYGEYLALLGDHARETIFAPESHDAPIQILGPFESSGQEFDALWFLGADDTAWPRRGRLHPLLPPAIQRQYAMAHSTPEDDWNLAHAVTARLLASAPRIVFSSSERDNDAEFRPSPLIAGLFPSGMRPTPTPLPSAPSAPATQLELIPDEPRSLPWPREQHAGGADVLQRQSACPFQAFAAKRLAATPLDSAERGLDAIAKGNLVHRVLQQFFTRVRTRDALVTARDTNQLDGMLDTAIDAVLATYASSDPWIQSYLAAEKRRLHTRLAEWLEIEAGRQPFTVESREKTLPDVQVGGLRLDLRADRIDLLADGSHLIIDYKTGGVSPSAWWTERPEEPQLPLYAAYGNIENLSGAVFAKIRAGSIGFDGRVRDALTQLAADLKPGIGLVREPWSDSMRDDWARVLRNLADQFLAGDAAVDPRNPKVCEYCDYHGLCRIAELHLAGADDDDGENGDD